MKLTVVYAKPSPGPVGELFGGDQSNINAEHFKLDPCLEASTPTSEYFNNQLTPHLLSVEAFTGYSGMSTKVTNLSPAGQTGVVVRSTAGMCSGQQLILGSGATREVVTIDVVASPVLLAMTTLLQFDHHPGEFVARGNRTHFEGYRTHMDGMGGGDYYAYSGRISLGNTGLALNPDQTHFSYAATAGLIDGDATATASGVYLQCSEFNILGSNYLGDHDIAAIGDVRSYQRNNDTGAKGAVWIGNLQKSEGTKYCNAAYSVLGKWLGGLDLINADFGPNRAAIKLAPDQRIFFNGSSVADEAGYCLWGNDPGSVYMNYSSGLGQLQFNVDNVTALAVTPNYVYTGANISFVAGGSISVKRNTCLYLDGHGGNTYLIFNGTNTYLVNNGVATQLNT